MKPRTDKQASIHDRYPLRTVARLTGLSPDLIRAWEKRYGVVRPVRGPRGARLYAQGDIDHLARLAKLVATGRAIGDVAALDEDGLRALDRGASNGMSVDTAPPSEIVGVLLAHVEKLQLPELEVRLGEALVALGTTRFIDDVAQPVLVEVGNRWAAGDLTVASEHLVSAAMRHVLGSLIRLRPTEPGSGLLLTTPAGELHEIGLMLVALRAADLGLRLYYLGPNLPADEIVQAARRSGVGAVGLSLVNSENRDAAIEHVRRIEDDLPADIDLWLGGRDAQQVAARLGKTRAVVIDQTEALDFQLKRVRGQARTGRR